MIDLNRLSVSLTKHGAHKLALLLEKYETSEILTKLWGVEPGINIELAQAKKNLAVDGFGNVPDVWKKAKGAGRESIGGLVLIAIIFSHHRLIEALREGRRSPFRGTIARDLKLGGKAFTNTAHIIEELGYSVSHTHDQVSYNFAKLFDIPCLNELALELIGLKFRLAGWNGKSSLIDELIRLKLNEVFAITADQFRNWLTSGDIDVLGELVGGDEEFFLDTGTLPVTSGKFTFTPGHIPKKTGSVVVTAPKTGTMAELLHNELQTALYEVLVRKHGAPCVGTEVPTGYGTSIDIVLKTSKLCVFYEIKVAKTVKACIRQAIPQLLEYAYWGPDIIANELHIASKFELTNEAKDYLGYLREAFSLPLHYTQIKL
jgi:hypothetical protein